MTTGLLLGQDDRVSAWTWEAFGLVPHHVNTAIGLLKDEELVGAALFHNMNGMNVNLSLYSFEGFTPGVIKFLARIALNELKVERVTFHVPEQDRQLRRTLERYGAVLECIMVRFYGRDKNSAAAQYALFAEHLIRLCGFRPWELN